MRRVVLTTAFALAAAGAAAQEPGSATRAGPASTQPPVELRSDSLQVDKFLCVATYDGNVVMKTGDKAFRGDQIKLFMSLDTPAPKAEPGCGAPVRAEVRGSVEVEAGGLRSSGEELAVYDFATGAVRGRGPSGGTVRFAPLKPKS